MLSNVSGKSAEPVSSLSSYLGVPLLLVDSTGWWSLLATDNSPAAGVNLAPAAEVVGEAISDIIIDMDMVGAAIFHHRQEDVLLLTSLLAKIGFFYGGARLYPAGTEGGQLSDHLLAAKRAGQSDYILLTCTR